MSADAYWLSPKGEIHEVKQKHINFVRDNLTLFKMTFDDYKDVYLKYKEPFGFEGKAREEIMINVMKRGWTRIRNYGNKGWSVEIWEMDKYTKDQLFNWAAKINENANESVGWEVVNIHVIKLEQANKPRHMWFIETTVNEILKGTLFENKLLKFIEFCQN